MSKRGITVANVFILMALLLCGVTGYEVLQHNGAVQEYEPTEATIESATVVEDYHDEEWRYRPEITYRYVVDGETYTNDNVFPGDFTRWSERQSWAEDWVREYSQYTNGAVWEDGSGETVTIYYDPADPAASYLVNDGMPTTWLILAGVGLSFLLVGLWLIRRGFRKRKIRTLLSDIPVESVQALSIGPSAVQGTVVAGEKTVSDPYSEDECAFAVYEIDDYHEGDENSGGSIVNVGMHAEYESFYLDDGTDRVLVRPDAEARYEFDSEKFDLVHEGDLETASPTLREYFADYKESWKARASGFFKTSRRYNQRTVEPGDEIYIFGTVDQRTDVQSGTRGERRVIQKIEGGLLAEPMFMLSDQKPADLVDDRKWVMWTIPYGAFMLILAVAIFLITFGPQIGVDVPIIF